MTFAAAVPWTDHSFVDHSLGSEGERLRDLLQDAAAPTSHDRTSAIAVLLEAVRQAEVSGGTAVSVSVFNKTMDFLTSLSAELPVPIVVVQSEEEIGLDWKEDDERTVSLTIDNTDRIGFTALRREKEASLLTAEAVESMLRDRLHRPRVGELSGSHHMEAEHAWFADATEELGRIDHYIRADGLPDVGRLARRETRRLLEELNPQPIAPVIYPSEGDLVIHFKAPRAPASVVIELSDDGRAVCYAHMHGKNRRASYDASTDLPDAFLLEQMHKLTNLG